MHVQAQPTDPLAQLREANGVFTEVLSNVTPEQMSLPTVNDEWNVRALINHLVGGNQWMAKVLKDGERRRGRVVTRSGIVPRPRPIPNRGGS